MVDNPMVGYILTIGLLFVVLTVYDFLKKKRFLSENVKNIPVLSYLPWIGSGHILMKDLNAGFKAFEKACRLTNSDHFVVYHGNLLIYMTANADDLQTIIPNVLERGFTYNFIGDNIMEKSILTVKVAKWRINRKIISKCFKQQTLNKKIPSINESIDEYFKSFASTEPGERMFEKNALFIMNNFLKHFVPFYHHEAKDNLATIYETLQLYVKNPFRRFKRPWLYPNIFYKFTAMKKSVDRLDMQNCQMLNKAVDNARDSLLKGKLKDDYEDLIINLEKVGTDQDVTVQECKLFTGAATDTTSFVFSMVLVACGIYPEVQEKILKEVLEVVGSTDPVEQYHLPQLKYTEMVVKETLRFFPAVPMIMRKTTETLKLGNGKVLPKDTELFLSLYNVQRSEKYWKDPLEFDPNRFLPEEVEKRHPFAYLPFSIGTRNCPGYKYAMIVLVVCAARFVRKYKIGCSTHKSIADIKLKTYMTLDLADKSLECTFTPRQCDGEEF